MKHIFYPIKVLFFLYNYLNGFLQFRKKRYSTAKVFFEKALGYNLKRADELLYQYYGQSLLCLGDEDLAFQYLVKSYKIYKGKGWVVESIDERLLLKNTLSAIKHIKTNKKENIENFNFNPIIKISKKR